MNPIENENIPVATKTTRLGAADLPEATTVQHAELTRFSIGLIQSLGRLGLMIPGGCIIASAVAAHALATAGHRVLWQAGTAMFRRDPEDGDAEMFSHCFGYGEGDGSFDVERALDGMASGHLGELHAWVALPDLGLLVDPSAILVPENFQLRIGGEWKHGRPSMVVKVQDLARAKPDAIYYPHPAAILAGALFFAELAGTIATEPEAVATLVNAAAFLKKHVGWPDEVTLKDLNRGELARQVILNVLTRDENDNADPKELELARKEIDIA